MQLQDTMKAFRILLLLIFIAIAECQSSDFLRNPSSVIQAEGVVATFLCQFPPAELIGWRINGTALNQLNPRSPEIQEGSALLSDGMGGFVSTEVLNITALPSYNGTVIRCIASVLNGDISSTELSSQAILTVQGPINPLNTLTTTSEVPAQILLSWEPPFSLDLTAVEPDIAYCVDVYNITDGGLVHLTSNCGILSPSYTFTVENPNPNDEFEFIITPRSNVEGARNGTQSRIIGAFNLQRPLITGTPEAHVLISASNNADGALTVIIEFTNGALSRAPIRRPENFSVAIQFINPPDNDIIDCPTTIVSETELLTQLSMNCSRELKTEQLGLFTIIASNRAGNVTLLNKQELSTHYIQNVSVIPGGVPGEAEVSCDFINSTELMGYLAIANGDLQVGYVIAERRSQVGRQVDSISNLAGGEYNTSIFTVNQTGLPELISVSFPRSVTILASGTQTITSVGRRPSPNFNVNVSEKVVSPNGNEVCYNCTFMDNDLDSTCVAIAHPCGVSSQYPGLFNISVTKFVRTGNSASGCVDISQCEIGHYVAVFYFNGQRGMIEGLPLAKMIPERDGDVFANDEPADITVAIVLTLLFTLIAVALVVVLIVLFMWKNNRFLRRKPRDSSEPGTSIESTENDDPSTAASTQDLVAKEPIYDKPVESPKRSASTECHYAETVTTPSSVSQTFEPPIKTEYADVCGYKNKEDQMYAILKKQPPSKEGTPDDLHKVEYSEVNTASSESIQEISRQSGDFEAYSTDQDDDSISGNNDIDRDSSDMLEAFLRGTLMKPEAH